MTRKPATVATARKRPANDADPIFAAIEAHRVVEADYIARCNASPDGVSCSETIKLLGKLCAMTPTTAAGCAALLRYMESYADEYRSHLFAEYGGGAAKAARTVLSRIAGVLDGKGGAK